MFGVTLNVKGTRPITYQYLEMIDDAKRNDGFVDQKKSKTADYYVFDSFNPIFLGLILSSGYAMGGRGGDFSAPVENQLPL